FGTNGNAKIDPSKFISSGSTTLADAELIEHAKSATNGAKFSRLWAGDTSGYPSQSEADLALCSILAFWTCRDAARIDHLFRQSRLIRPKWDEQHGDDTYGQMTIAKAISGCSEVYGAKTYKGPTQLKLVHGIQVCVDSRPATEVLRSLVGKPDTRS